MKPLLSIEEQIARLIENKNVKVNSQIEKEKFKSYLLKYNYINVIGSTKLLFATGYNIVKKEYSDNEVLEKINDFYKKNKRYPARADCSGKNDFISYYKF